MLCLSQDATCDPERGRYDISRTDLTQRPCAGYDLGSATSPRDMQYKSSPFETRVVAAFEPESCVKKRGNQRKLVEPHRGIFQREIEPE